MADTQRYIIYLLERRERERKRDGNEMERDGVEQGA
jgi:hypothetical protein